MGQYEHIVSCLLDDKFLEAAVPCDQRLIALLFLLNLTFSIKSIAQFSDLVR